MFGTEGLRKGTATATLAGMLVAGLTLILPEDAFAQNNMLYSPSQGSTQSLRNPLIPTAPTANPYQPAFQGQPPPVGDGATPAPLIRGDLGGSQGVPSGMADPTHGNIFPTRGGQAEDGPQNYVPDAGRRQTEAGQQQGMFEFGQGQANGTGLINNGGPANDSTGMGPGGKNGGSGWVNNGGPHSNATGMSSGGTLGGTGWINNGGPAPDATGMGSGGKNGGTGLVNNGGAGAGASGSGPGGKNGGAGVVNNGGSSGVGVVNNGGPSPNAQGSGDRLYQQQRQPNRYDFQGPLPTVRTFSRYLVILGAVSATVFMSLAAWSMVMGNQYGAARVMGAASGLLMLLAAYTIWKVVQMNTFNANSTGWESHYRDGTPQNLPGPGGAQPNNGPFTPPANPNGGPPAANPNGGPPAANPNGGPPAANPNGGGPIPQPPGSPFGPPGGP